MMTIATFALSMLLLACGGGADDANGSGSNAQKDVVTTAGDAGLANTALLIKYNASHCRSTLC